MCTLSLWGHTATHTDAHLHVRLTRESRDSVLVSHTRRQKTTKQPWAPTAVNTLAQQPSDPIPARRLRPPLPYICTLRELNSCPLKCCLWVGGRMAGGGCRGLGVGGGELCMFVYPAAWWTPLIICSCRHSCCFRGFVCFCVHIKQSVCGRAKTWPHIYADAPAVFVYHPARSCWFQPHQNCCALSIPLWSCFASLSFRSYVLRCFLSSGLIQSASIRKRT